MRSINNEKGIALVTALLLTLVTLGVLLGVFYLLSMQTKTSAADKVYSSALQAAYGDSEFLLKDLLPLLFVNDSLKPTSVIEKDFERIALKIPDDACMNDKLHKDTDQWACGDIDRRKTHDAWDYPDTTIILKGRSEDYKVFSKIVDTVAGNTDDSGATERFASADGVTGRSDTTDSQRKPYLYTVEIQAQSASDTENKKEKALLEVLYAY